MVAQTNRTICLSPIHPRIQCAIHPDFFSSFFHSFLSSLWVAVQLSIYLGSVLCRSVNVTESPPNIVPSWDSLEVGEEDGNEKVARLVVIFSTIDNFCKVVWSHRCDEDDGRTYWSGQSGRRVGRRTGWETFCSSCERSEWIPKSSVAY